MNVKKIIKFVSQIYSKSTYILCLWLWIYVYINICIYLSIYHSICLSVWSSINQSICLADSHSLSMRQLINHSSESTNQPVNSSANRPVSTQHPRRERSRTDPNQVECRAWWPRSQWRGPWRWGCAGRGPPWAAMSSWPGWSTATRRSWVYTSMSGGQTVEGLVWGAVLSAWRNLCADVLGMNGKFCK